MKKAILIAVIALVALATAQAQVISDEDFSGSTMVIDSTEVENDMKLLIAHDRLYGKNGLINVLIKQASKEKAETGTIVKAAATQRFIDNIGVQYEKYASKFIKVDTVYVDSIKIENQITKIKEWQEAVINDPEIKEATSLSVWEKKSKRLEKLLYYQKRLQ
jgi:hypothetical protein